MVKENSRSEASDRGAVLLFVGVMLLLLLVATELKNAIIGGRILDQNYGVAIAKTDIV